MKLIENWRNAWRMLSVQAAALLGIVAAAYDYLPTLQTYLPEGWVKYAALLVILARVVKQESLHADGKD
jgi:hypothetical protein